MLQLNFEIVHTEVDESQEAQTVVREIVKKFRKFPKSAHSYLLDTNRALIYQFSTKNKTKIAESYTLRSKFYYGMGFYEHCLNSLKLAEPNHEDKNSIDDIREKCLKAMKKKKDKSTFPNCYRFKLTFPPNPKMPFFIDSLNTGQDFVFGKVLTSSRDLRAGNVIANINNPLVVISDDMRESLCFQCGRNNNFDLRIAEAFSRGLTYGETEI